MTKPGTVILWGPDDLFSQAMEVLLKAEEGCKLIKMPATRCVRQLVEEARKIKPDLLIIYPGLSADESDPLMKLLEEQPEVQALADLRELKVIFVSPENNVVHVYSKHSLNVRRVSDLLAIMEDRHSSDYPVEKEVHTGRTNE